MFIEKLKELKKKTNLTAKQIAEKTNLPERTVNRIFSGETPNPYVDTLHRIVTVLGGSLDEILTDTKLVVGEQNLATLQENVDSVSNELELAKAELELALAENAILKNKTATLSAELDLIKMELRHKEELLAVHNYYTKLNQN